MGSRRVAVYISIYQTPGVSKKWRRDRPACAIVQSKITYLCERLTACSVGLEVALTLTNGWKYAHILLPFQEVRSS